MTQIFRSALIHNLFSLLLISLLALKVGLTISTLKNDKSVNIVKIYTDAEKSEKGEKKDTEKQHKTYEYLTSDNRQTLETAGKKLKKCIRRYNCFYSIDHFNSVPSPPPDLSA
ncbi:hypothetical protein H8S90_09435 [Olivibacter sp. SDN3]|uniref:hypothetical protein n=1 Tax=Olivibacter sp. SDN3 TaxID=2764720 RepID=UPI0016518554|nr:hypothetical protein [Olivibacter sp. SDN3]QNL51772.1 hypothetical protein H8S90_09435 [Olivibacter sp. SDN3]